MKKVRVGFVSVVDSGDSDWNVFTTPFQTESRECRFNKKLFKVGIVNE